MLQYITYKMQALPASFFNLIFASFLAGMIFSIQIVTSFMVYADGELSFADNIKRMALVKQAARSSDVLSSMDKKDIEILLRRPTLKRDEIVSSAWYYHGESCALDVYFTGKQSKPAYIEFRALSLNDDINAQYEMASAKTWNDQCLRDVLDAQGVSTPSSVARRPLPSIDNPYRS